MPVGSSTTIKKYQVTKQDLHVLEARKALKDEQYELAIKEINEAIAMSNCNKNVIKEKVDIVSMLQCLAYDGLQKDNIGDTLKYIRLILGGWDYLWKNNTYSEIVMNTFWELFKYLNSKKSYDSAEEALELVQDAGIYLRESDCSDLKIEKNKYVIGYLKKIRFQVETLDIGLRILEKHELHLRTIDGLEVKKYKIVLYNRFNNYKEIVNVLNDDFRSFLDNNEGKRLVDLCSTTIRECKDEEIINRYSSIFVKNKLPKFFLEEGIEGNFFFEVLSDIFDKYIQGKRYELCDEIFECIYKYFDYKKLNKEYFIVYLRKKKIYTLGIEYFNNLIKSSPVDFNLIQEKCDFVREIKGAEKSSKIYSEEIVRIEKLRDPRAMCEGLERYKRFTIDIKKVSDYEKLLLK